MEEAEALLESGDFKAARKKVVSAMGAYADVEGAADLLLHIKGEEKATLQLKRGQEAADRQEWQTAFTAVKAGLQDAPDGGDTEKALQNLQKDAVKNLVSNGLNRGYKYSGAKNWSLASAAFKQVLVYDPKNSKAKSGLRKAARELRKAKPAEKDPVVVKDPGETKDPSSGGSKHDQARAKAVDAKNAKRAGNVPLAITLYGECLKLSPGNQKCRADIVPMLMAQGKRCTALKHMKRYVKSWPGAAKTPQFKRLIRDFEPQCN